MTLEQRLTEDMKDAMRAKDELKLSVIRMLRGQILLEKKKGTGGTDVPDDVVVALVRGHVKRLKETIEQTTAVGRTDLADAAKKELVLAQVYLPAEMTDEELDPIVRDALAQAGVPVCLTLAGGYAEDIRDTVEINVNTLRVFA